jgi:hypothetical protein
MLRTLRTVAGCLLSCAALASAGAQGTPANGTEVFARMRAAYGSWYKTLTFVQTTTLKTRDGRDTMQTWYESLRYTPAGGTQLRIDVAPLSNGNASISTWDSTWVIRADTLAATRASGNPFLPLIEGAYMQPAERTAKEVGPLGIDLTKVRAATWEGRAAWVVGSSGESDSTSAQFWVDVQRLVVVRMLLSGGPGRPPLDIRLDKFEKVGKGWLATRVEMLQGGQMRQREEYADWKGDVALDPKLFDPKAGKGAKHWAKPGA